MVLSHPDDGSGWDTTEEETIADMRKEFEGWDPVYVSNSSMHDVAETLQTVQDYKDDRQDTQVALVQWVNHESLDIRQARRSRRRRPRNAPIHVSRYEHYDRRFDNSLT